MKKSKPIKKEEDNGFLIKKLENPYPNRNRVIKITTPSFECKSIVTGGTLRETLIIEYIPNLACVELISLYEYLASLQNQALLQETIPIHIMNKLVTSIQPHYMKVIAVYKPPPDMEMNLEISDEYISPTYKR